jgi:hypothetical protein
MPNDTVRASDTALPKSRRLFLLAGTTAALAATLKGVAVAATVPDDDGELFELLRIWQETSGRVTETCRLFEEIDEEDYAPKPTALTATDEDVELGLCTAAKLKDGFGYEDVVRFRGAPITRCEYKRWSVLMALHPKTPSL